MTFTEMIIAGLVHRYMLFKVIFNNSYIINIDYINVLIMGAVLHYNSAAQENCKAYRVHSGQKGIKKTKNEEDCAPCILSNVKTLV
jgi:hypothetical protein